MLKQGRTSLWLALVTATALMILAACGGASPVATEPTAAPVETAVAAEPTAEPAPTEEPPTAEPEPPSVPPPSDELLHLRSGEWQWIAYAGPVEEYAIETPGNYRVTFNDDATFTAVADCNNVAGNYVASDGGEITITPGPMTLAACPEGSRSDQFVAFLGSATRYASDGDNLVLELLADGGTMTFAPAGTDESTMPAATGADLAAVLGNLTYGGVLPDYEAITLTDGFGDYEEEGGGSPYVSLAANLIATGDLDRDGNEDAVTFLVDHTTGSADFVHLVVVLNALKDPQPVVAELLGDRTPIKSLTVEDNRMIIEMLEPGPNDVACCPSQLVQRAYVLQDYRIYPLSSEVLGPVSLETLDGTSWQLVNLNGEQVNALPDIAVTLAFDEDQVSGSGGCNDYSGPVVGGDLPQSVAIGPITATERQCADEVMAQENTYLTQLANVVAWRYDFGRLALTFKGADEELGDLIFAPAAPAMAGTPAGLPAEIVTQLDTYLQSQVYTEGGIPANAAPGLVLYVKTPDGAYLNAAGVSSLEDGTPMQGSDILEIGSNTKSMTIVLLMQLVEQGLISLDDPLSKYLPEQAAALPNGDQITIRQMAQHTAGLWDYGDEIIGGGVTDSGKLEASYTPAELVQYAADNGSPYFAPGTEGQWHYSNTGYVLLGMIIEQITGQTIGDLLQTRIFDPLGMESATFLEGVPQPGEITTQGYWWTEDGQRVNTTNWNASQGWAAGAAAMTAADLARYGQALAAGELFQNPETLNEMLTFYPAAKFSVGGPYGLGLIDFAGDGTVWGHGGQTLGFQSLWYVDPAKDIVVVGLTNSASYSADAFLNVYQILTGTGALPVGPITLTPLGSLIPTTWAWKQFANPAETTDIDPAAGLKLAIGKDGSVTVNTSDCGSAFGNYTVGGGGQIDFVIDASSLTCDAGSPAAQFVQHLNDAARWSFANGRLLIELPVDGGTLVFEEAALE
jgi:D-alanyl-D-alanine carboxypeptidase